LTIEIHSVRTPSERERERERDIYREREGKREIKRRRDRERAKREIEREIMKDIMREWITAMPHARRRACRIFQLDASRPVLAWAGHV
jgi:hypothetical protein